jgi:hypothetical protein
MANKKVTDLTAASSVVAADVIPVVTDVAGTPTTKKATLQKVVDLVLTNEASDTLPGVVSTGAQAFLGEKTFNGKTKLGGNFTGHNGFTTIESDTNYSWWKTGYGTILYWGYQEVYSYIAWRFQNNELDSRGLRIDPHQVDNGNSGTAITLSMAHQKHKVTLTDNVTFTLSSSVVGADYEILIFTGAGSFTVTWPSNVKWPGGSTPTITTTASRMDKVKLYYDGTNYYGEISQNYTP